MEGNQVLDLGSEQGRQNKYARRKQPRKKSRDMYQLVFDDYEDDDDEGGGDNNRPGREEGVSEEEDDDQSLSPSERVAKILGKRESELERWPSENEDIMAPTRDANENYNELQFRYSLSLDDFDISEGGSQKEVDAGSMDGGGQGTDHTGQQDLDNNEADFVQIVSSGSPGSDRYNVERGDQEGSPNQGRGFLGTVLNMTPTTSPIKTNSMLAVRYVKPTFTGCDDNYIDDELQPCPANNDDDVDVISGIDRQASLPHDISLHYDEDTALDLPSIDTESWSRDGMDGRTGREDDRQPIICGDSSNGDARRPQRWAVKHRKLLIGLGGVALVVMLAALGTIIYFIVVAVRNK